MEASHHSTYFLNSKKIISSAIGLLVSLFFVSINFSSCISIDNKFEGLPPGIWRSVLRLDSQLPEASENESSKALFKHTELPFNFEVIYANEDSFYIELINGDERILVNDISYGVDRKTAKDTVIINFPVYDSYIKAIYEEGIMEGDWFVNYKDNYSIPFKAYHGVDYRFPITEGSPNEYIDGKWETSFDYDKEKPYPAIGMFSLAEDQKLTGTFKTETGDYRFLEGQAVNDKIQLSCFDGSHAFLFEAKMLADSSLIGSFYSGKHYKSNFSAKKNDAFSLSSVYELTKATSDDAFSMELKNTSGKLISLEDERYKNKAKLIQIFGSWCPNCRDETKFLVDFAKSKPENLEIIGVAFERYKDEAKAIETIQRYKDKMNIPYDLLHGGIYNKAEASKVFPMLNKIISYPTLIFLDTDNNIQKIHTGFNGPATDEYEAFKKEFYELIDQITS